MWHFRCKNCREKAPATCHTCEVQRFLRDCQAARELIGWYLDSYHHADLGHREMMTRLESLITTIQERGEIAASDRALLYDIEQRVDHWLYQTI